jgi:hypothetical protein
MFSWRCQKDLKILWSTHCSTSSWQCEDNAEVYVVGNCEAWFGGKGDRMRGLQERGGREQKGIDTPVRWLLLGLFQRVWLHLELHLRSDFIIFGELTFKRLLVFEEDFSMYSG